MNTNDELEKLSARLADMCIGDTKVGATGRILLHLQRVRDDERAAIEKANRYNDTGEPIDVVLAAISDCVLDIKPDAESGNAGTIIERVEAAADMARRFCELEAAQKSKEVMKTEPRDELPVREMHEHAMAVIPGAGASDDKHASESAHESAKRIAEIWELEAKATPGPWFWNQYRATLGQQDPQKETDIKAKRVGIVHWLHSEDDMRFCAAARTALPLLLSRVTALEAELKVERAKVAHYWGERDAEFTLQPSGEKIRIRVYGPRGDETECVSAHSLSYIELRKAREKISELEADAEIGRQWRENSSLEKWFPYDAAQLKSLEAKLAEAFLACEKLCDWQKLPETSSREILEKFLVECIAACASVCRNTEPPAILTELSTLQRQAEEAKRDTERLDYLQEHRPPIDWYSGYLTSGEEYIRCQVAMRHSAPTLREAIDTALQRLATGKEGEK